jgi:nucleotide-binding universal stress UspA family protein
VTQPADASPATAVVVGVDGSEHSLRALEWAAHEARLIGAPLHIVHAFPHEFLKAGSADPHVGAAARSLHGLAARLQELDSRPLSVSTEVADGVPTKVLVEESRRAALLVVGSRGHGGFARLLLGSTAVDVTAHATCPVAVIPAGGDLTSRTGDVVVGVDASAGSERALGFAFARASQRQARLVAMHVWQLPAAFGASAEAQLLRTDTDHVQAEARALLTDALVPWQEQYPDVAVDARVAMGQTVSELAHASGTEAEVVVVGARGRSALAGMVVGSVSQGLLRHAAGPVVVVR